MRQKLNNLYRSLLARPDSGRYEQVGKLVAGLLKMETGAVEYVMEKAWPSVRYLTRKAQLPENLARDILHDALVILVKKIRDQVYNPDESAPATYLIAIARNLIANQLRHKRNTPTIALDDIPDISDDHTKAFLESRENRELLESLLQKLGEPCARLIRLKYIDGYRDEEIIAQNMTHYNTSMALRTKRSKCFQKLIELATATKPADDTINTNAGHPQDQKSEMP